MSNKIQSIYKILNQYVNWSKVSQSCGISRKTVYAYVNGDYKNMRTAVFIANKGIEQLTKTSDSIIKALDELKLIAMSPGAEWPNS